MKLNKIFLVIVLSLATLMISGCAAPIPAGIPMAAVKQDVLYAAGGPAVVALRPDGTQLWRYPTQVDGNRSFYSTPLVTNGEVIVSDYQAERSVLYGLDAGNGTEKWTFKDATARFVAGAVALNDQILAANADGNVYALSKTGSLVWTFKTKAGVWAEPLVSKSIIYVVSLDHTLYAVNATNGTQVWACDLGAPALAAPAIGTDGTLYVGTLGSKLHAVSPEQGNILWTFDTKGAVWSTPVLKNGVLHFGDLGGKIFAVNAKDGNAAWSIDALSGSVCPITAAPGVIPSGLVYVCETGEILAIGYQNERLWTDKVTSGKLYSSPVVVGERVVIPAQSGDPVLVSYDLSGRKDWAFAAIK